MLGIGNNIMFQPQVAALRRGASLEYNFLNASLNPIIGGVPINFSRSSAGWRTNSAGILVQEPANIPRFDYDPITFAPKGLLIEEQRAGALIYSEEFDNAAWAKSEVSVISNAVIAPNGTLTADKIVESNVIGAHSVRQFYTPIAGSVISRSIFAKAAERGGVYINFSGTGGASFNLLTGQVNFAGAAGNTSWENVTATIQPAGDGWYRCGVNMKIADAYATGSQTLRIGPCDSTFAGTQQSNTGDGVSDVYLWGANLDVGALLTSYIQATSAATTRAADFATINSLAGWFNPAEGTLFAEFDWLGATNFDYVLSFNDGTSNNLLAIGIGSAGTSRFIATADGVTQAAISHATLTPNTAARIAFAYKANDFQGATNGALSAADTSGSIPLVTQASLTSSVGSTNQFNGHLRRIRYYPRRLSNAELQAITL